MTTCIAVMNRTAAALAADSTVSIPYRFGTKHFQGVSKVIAAHAKDPVGLMVYGSPDFAGLPWEIVIEEFRQKHSKSQDHVKDHARLFFEFLEQQLGEWAEQPVQEELADTLFMPLLDSIAREWNQRVARVPTSEYGAALDTIVQETVQQWTTKTRRPSTSLRLDTVDVTARVTEALKELGRWTENLTPDAKAMIVDAANWSTRRLSKHELYFSGLVFAGFGARQPLPALTCHLLGVPYAGKLRKIDSQPAVQEVSARRPAIVATFAENGSAKTFMEGIDPGIRQWFVGMAKQQGVQLGLGPSYSDQLNDELKLQINQRAESIITAVSYLPKAGLAEFAESLVRITALSLRMSMAPETVGEPIDVAVLSRSDGLVWVKRTPYFPRDLQPPLPPSTRSV
jgi:hypothetical protein